MEQCHMTHNKVDLIAKFFLIIGIFFIPVSTAAMTIGLSVATVLVLFSGHYHEKVAFLKARPALWMPLILFALILVSAVHGIVPWSERLVMVKKYHQLLAIPFLAWLFIEESTRKKALFAFLLPMVIIWIFIYER